ncbi:hypothetical protein [Methanosarcina horonobensis]|uniref:hypothetical protein n=1 Tax=Methanosarcina horonobensis TaxID=418008 RepID=UPI000AAA0C71|nr:hypothetical protein [Methanosarcina horonobensis]
MRGLMPARVPAHKARKVELRSHLPELIFQTRGEIKPAYRNTIRNLFQTPDLEKLYPQEVQA